jgi:hypothetical protein
MPHAPRPESALAGLKDAWTNLPRPETAEDQEEQLLAERQRRQAAALSLTGETSVEAPRRKFPPGAPTPAELLAVRRDPTDGHPVEEPPDAMEPPWLRDDPNADRNLRNKQLNLAYRSLNNQQQSQIQADLRWGAEDGPRWHVSIPNDPAQPPLVLKAASAELAKGRYLSLCGINSLDPKNVLQVDPYPEAS